MDPITLAGAGFKILGGLVGRSKAKREARRQELLEAERRAEMDRLKQVYSDISTTNPYLDLENAFEDLTINQQQAQFESQQLAQSQANILSGLRSAAGSSGIASLAQSLAQQGQLRAQQAAASIGRQEAANQSLAAQQANRLQTLEAQGEIISRQQQRDLTGTLLGMAQQETAAARESREEYESQRADYTSGLFGTVGDTINSFGGVGNVFKEIKNLF